MPALYFFYLSSYSLLNVLLIQHQGPMSNLYFLYTFTDDYILNLPFFLQRMSFFPGFFLFNLSLVICYILRSFTSTTLFFFLLSSLKLNHFSPIYDEKRRNTLIFSWKNSYTNLIPFCYIVTLLLVVRHVFHAPGQEETLSFVLLFYDDLLYRGGGDPHICRIQWGHPFTSPITHHFR